MLYITSWTYDLFEKFIIHVFKVSLFLHLDLLFLNVRQHVITIRWFQIVFVLKASEEQLLVSAVWSTIQDSRSSPNPWAPRPYQSKTSNDGAVYLIAQCKFCIDLGTMKDKNKRKIKKKRWLTRRLWLMRTWLREKPSDRKRCCGDQADGRKCGGRAGAARDSVDGIILSIAERKSAWKPVVEFRAFWLALSWEVRSTPAMMWCSSSRTSDVCSQTDIISCDKGFLCEGSVFESTGTF